MSASFARLKDIGEFKAGFGFPLELQGKSSGDFPFAKVGDISSIARLGNKYIVSAGNFVDKADLLKLKAKTIPVGTIVFAKIGEAIKQNFRAITSVEMIIDNNTMGLVPNSKIINIDYLYYFMRQLDLYRHVGTTTVPALRKSVLEELEIPLPPLPEQQRIAAILDQADAIRRKRQQAIQLADEFLRSVFLEMFGDPVTNPKGWDTLLLGNCIVNGPTNGLYKPSTDYGSGVKILRIDGFYDGKIHHNKIMKRVNVTDAEIKKFSLLENSIVINRVNSREYLGKCALIENLEEITLFESNIMNFTINDEVFNPVFMISQLSSQYIRNQILTNCKDAVNQSSINQSDVKSFEIRHPPIELQREFARRVQAVEGLKAKLKASQAQAETQFNALSQRAFAGEL